MGLGCFSLSFHVDHSDVRKYIYKSSWFIPAISLPPEIFFWMHGGGFISYAMIVGCCVMILSILKEFNT